MTRSAATESPLPRLDPETTLRELASRPPDVLRRGLEALGPFVLDRLERAVHATGPGPDCLTSRQLRHALCASLGAAEDAVPDRVRFVDHCQDLASLSLRELIDRLTAPAEGCASSTWIAEFAWSVACEARESRRVPEERGCRLRPERSFRLLYDRCNDELVVRCRSITAGCDPPIDAPSLAAEAWALSFRAYWSERSGTRFLGRCRVVLLLQVVARHEVFRLLRSDTETVPLDAVPDPPAGRPPWTERDRRRWAERLRSCVEGLPPKRRIVWDLHHRRGLSPSEIAARLHVGRPTVTEHLKKAAARLEASLRRFLDDHAEAEP